MTARASDQRLRFKPTIVAVTGISLLGFAAFCAASNSSSNDISRLAVVPIPAAVDVTSVVVPSHPGSEATLVAMQAPTTELASSVNGGKDEIIEFVDDSSADLSSCGADE